MNTFTLRLSHRHTPVTNPPAGFVVFGASPAQWLPVLCGGQADAASAAARYETWRYFAVPHSQSDNRPVGLLCLPGIAAVSAASQAIKPPAGTIALVHRCGLSAEPSTGLWLPTDSHWFPSLPEEALAQRLPRGLVCVWLASTGLIGFEPGDALKLHDLVAVPSDRCDAPAWQSPPQPVALPQRLSGLSLLQPPGLETLFGDADQSIGNQGDALEQLPGDSFSGQIRSHFLQFMKQLGVGPSDSADSSNSNASSDADAQPSWLSSKLSGLLQSQREQQLSKLLELFGRDPDKALQYALPIGGDASYRGIAPPGGSLPSQRPDFSLGGLRGGGPADFWDIGQATRQRLNHAYREQANRELALGRHRRAAYIYAHLLGDFSSAAATLEQGHFFTEAAALYQHKLKRLDDAARCLCASGQYAAASEIYEQKSDYVSAAEVWQQAGEEDRARELFQQAVQFQLANQKPILAAELLDKRLHDRAAAIELLLKQWPGGAEPVRAMGQAFVWLGENGEHQRSRDVLQQVLEHAPHQDMLAVATVAGEVALHYPDAAIRRAAEDGCRVAIASQLAAAPAIEVRERMTRLRKLFPDDAMLQRDVTRYLIQHPPHDVPAPAPTRALAPLEYLGRFQLAAAERYLHFQMIRGDLLAIGTDHFKLRAVRVADLGTPTPRHTECLLQLGQPLSSTTCCALHPALDADATRIEIYFGGSTPVYFRSDQLPSPYQQSVWWLSTPLALSGMGEGACVATDQTGGVWALASDDTDIVLREMRPPEKNIRSYTLLDAVVKHSLLPDLERQAPGPFQPHNLHLTCVANTPFAVLDDLLVSLEKGRALVLASLPGSVRGLCPSLPHTRRRIAIAHSQGVDLYWLDHTQNHLQSVERGTAHQHVAFLHGAHLAAIADDVLTIYQIRSEAVKKLRQIQLRSQQVLTLMSISTECIAVAYEDGGIDRYKAV